MKELMRAAQSSALSGSEPNTVCTSISSHIHPYTERKLRFSAGIQDYKTP